MYQGKVRWHSRYLGRESDFRDSLEKLAKRFEGYIRETLPVEEVYWDRSAYIHVNGKAAWEEIVAELEQLLGEGAQWKELSLVTG